MTTIPFDTLKLAKSLREHANFTAEQAEGLTQALSAAFEDRVATKDDLLLLEQRLTIKMGGMFVVAIGAIVSLVKLIP